MTDRPGRVFQPPPTSDARLAQWMRQVTDAVNTLDLPHHSSFSRETPEGHVAATPGTYGHNLASAHSAGWIKQSGSSTTGWSSLATERSVDSFESRIHALEHIATAYGGMFKGLGRTVNVDPASYVTVTSWKTAMPSSDVLVNLNAGTLTVQVDGIYYAWYGSSFSGVANTEYEAYIAVNGVNNYAEFHRKLGTGGDVGAASCGQYLSLQSGDIVSIRATTESGSGNFMGHIAGQFFIGKVG